MRKLTKILLKRLSRAARPYLKSSGLLQVSGVYNRINWAVVRYVATYRRRMRPQVMAKISQHAADKQVVFLTSRARTRRWLEQVAASH